MERKWLKPFAVMGGNWNDGGFVWLSDRHSY